MYYDVVMEGLTDGIVHSGCCDICGEPCPIIYSDWESFLTNYLTGTWRPEIYVDLNAYTSYDISGQNLTIQFYPDGNVESSYFEGEYHYEFLAAVPESEEDVYPSVFDLHGYLVDQNGNQLDSLVVTSNQLDEPVLIAGSSVLILHSLDHPFVPDE